METVLIITSIALVISGTDLLITYMREPGSQLRAGE